MDPEIAEKIKKIWKTTALAILVIVLIGFLLLFGIAWYFDRELATWETDEIAWYDKRKARAVPFDDGPSLTKAMREFDLSGGVGKFVGSTTLPGENRPVFLEMNSFGDREPTPAQLAAYEHLRANYPELKARILTKAAEKHNDLRAETLKKFEGIPHFLLGLLFRKSFMGDLEGRMPELAGSDAFDRQDYEIWLIPTQHEKDGMAYVGLKFRSPWNMLFLTFVITHGGEVFADPPWKDDRPGAPGGYGGGNHPEGNIFEKLRQLQNEER